MAQLDPSRRALSLKVVYWGPEGGGKTTNVQHLHARYPEARRGRLVKLDTDLEETHFFDYFPAFLGSIEGWEVRLDVVSAPGRPDLTTTRHAILDYADGVVFVADSAPGRRQDNLDALAELRAVLSTLGRQVALAFQWNHRDRQRRLPVDDLEHLLNIDGAPSQTAIAHKGDGVWETHRLIVTTLLTAVREALPTMLALLGDGEEPVELPLFHTSPERRPRSGQRIAGPRADTMATGVANTSPDLTQAAPPVVAHDDPHVARVHALARTPGVMAAAIATRDGALLAATGPIDAAPMVADAARADVAIAAAADLMGLGAPVRWSVDVDAIGWHLLHEEDHLVLVSGPSAPTPGESLLRVFGPERTP